MTWDLIYCIVARYGGRQRCSDTHSAGWVWRRLGVAAHSLQPMWPPLNLPLTGGDLDTESIQHIKDSVYVGDEFGPYLVEADAASGKVRGGACCRLNACVGRCAHCSFVSGSTWLYHPARSAVTVSPSCAGRHQCMQRQGAMPSLVPAGSHSASRSHFLPLSVVLDSHCIG
jgi:hypothetical protein